MKQALRVTVLGAAGRMGRELLRSLIESDDTELAAALVMADSREQGLDAGELAGVGAVGCLAGGELAPEQDVLIDFSTAAALTHYLPQCAQRGIAVVSGVTALDQAATNAIDQAAAQTPVLWAPNLSFGVHLCYRLVAQAAKALGAEADIEVLEAHHRHKKDAPSGTALRLGQVAAQARGQSLEQVGRFHRQGSDSQRQPGEIGFAVVRAGDIVGEHTVMFSTMGERIEITHRAASRQAFVQGAIRAAGWIVSRPPGRYGMDDVLGA